jgi:type IV pilus assembly protein PilC
MLYKYHAYKLDKQVTTGTIDAVTEQHALDALYESGFKYVLDLEEQKPRSTLHQVLPSLFGVKNSDIIDFSRQMAAFLESGSSLRTSLELLKEQNTKSAIKELIADIISRIEQGDSFSEAIKAHPQVFPHSYWEVIQSCEKTGELEKGLSQIATYMENRAVIIDKVRRALAYPIFVICLAIGVMILMVTTVLPSIVKLFDSFQTALPPLTRILLSSIDFVIDYKFFLLGVLVGLPLLVLAVYQSNPGKEFIDRIVLRLPVAGSLIVDHNLGMFCRSAAMLLKAGLPLPNIMEVAVRSATGNRIISRSISELKTHLIQGEGLSAPMSRDPLFPSMMVKMIKVGEHTGTLDSSLDTLAEYYQNRTSKRIATMIALIEPTLTIVIGVAIAFLMVSMIIPIYKIMGAAR